MKKIVYDDTGRDMMDLLTDVHLSAKRFLAECPGCQDIVNPDICEGDGPTKVQSCACNDLRGKVMAVEVLVQRVTAGDLE